LVALVTHEECFDAVGPQVTAAIAHPAGRHDLRIGVKVAHALDVANQEGMLAGLPCKVRESIWRGALVTGADVAVVLLKNTFDKRLNAHERPTGSLSQFNDSAFDKVDFFGNALRIELACPPLRDALGLNVPKVRFTRFGGVFRYLGYKILTLSMIQNNL